MESQERKGRRHKVDKHTFKVGDRVKSVRYVNSRARGDEYGKVVGVRDQWVDVEFDRKDVNRLDGRWSLCNNEVQHDTDFQVGDWVRYEGVNHLKVPSKEGQVGVITSINNRGYVRARGICADLYLDSQPTSDKSNLVKIQPPQKDSDDTIIHVFTSYTNKEEKKMDIRRKEDGAIVRDVKEAHKVGYKWIKHSPDCRTEYSEEYWEPVEEWVKIEVRKSEWETINTQIGTFEAWGLDDDCHTVSWRPVK